MKIGLVLEGGAMRGMYTAGVLDIFLDNNIKTDAVIGVSAGALFGVNYLSGQRGRVIRYNKRFNRDKNYIGLGQLIKTGNIINTEYAYYTVPQKLDVFDDRAFMASGVPYYAVVTNLYTGRPEYIRLHSVFEQMEVLRASASMPFLARPVTLDGQQYLDGGVADSIPYRKLMSLGCDKLIVVLTRDISYVKKPQNRLAVETVYGRYPAFASRLLHRHEDYAKALAEISELEECGTAFVIRPSAPIELSRMETDPEKLQSVYELGCADCRDRLDALREFIR